MTVRDYIFLYCYLIYGQQKEEILSVLAPERSERIRKELRKFDRFPKEVRLTLVLKLLGYLVQHIRNRNIEMVHPTWISQALEHEDPQIVLTILSNFTPTYRDQVLQLLKPSSHPVADPLKMGAEDSNQVIFQIFSNRFASMAAPWGDTELSLNSLYLLDSEDLIALISRIGVREIAMAFVLAGKDVVAALVPRFPQEHQEALINAIKEARTQPEERRKQAAKRLSGYDLASMPLEEAILKVGLAVMRGALVGKNDQLVRMVAQRLPHRAGTWMLQAGRDEIQVNDEAGIMQILNDLIAAGRIDKTAAENRFAAPSKSRMSGIY